MWSVLVVVVLLRNGGVTASLGCSGVGWGVAGSEGWRPRCSGAVAVWRWSVLLPIVFSQEFFAAVW